MARGDVDALIEAYHQALQTFLTGDPRPIEKLYSRRDDVTLANPFGPTRVGDAEVGVALREAAANFRGGSVRFDPVSEYVTDELAYLVQREDYDATLRGDDEPTRFSLRVTMVFRREDGGWTVSHRHADPITAPQSARSAVEPSP